MAPTSTRRTPARAVCASRDARNRRARSAGPSPPPARGDHAAYRRKLESVMAKTAGVRRWGAAALDLAFVAAGRYDAFFEYGFGPWDVGPRILLVRGGGGGTVG